jgi:hypothetical protein
MAKAMIGEVECRMLARQDDAAAETLRGQGGSNRR